MGVIIMPFRVDIFENGTLVKQEHFDNLNDAKSFQDLWNGYQRTPGVPWKALIVTEDTDYVQPPILKSG
jgi:hypothetical protein